MAYFKTLNDIIFFQAANFKHAQAFNFKKNNELISFSNQEFLNKAIYFACGLKEIGFKEKSTLAIFAYQCPIWLIADFGALLAGAITVPIFYNISKENLEYELEDSKTEYVFCDKQSATDENSAVLKNKKLITLNFDNKNLSENQISFEDLILLGKKAFESGKYTIEKLQNCAKPEDLATIIYTSGSTGKPKGVELTHNNLISQIIDTKEFFPLDSEHDIVLSFLPLAHIFERMVMMYYITQGVRIYFADDTKNVGTLLKEFNPTLMTVVPRVLEKVFIKIQDAASQSSLIKKILAKAAIARALAKNPEKPKAICDKIFDHLVYKKFRLALGNKMRMIICGGAALSQDIEKFYLNIGVSLYVGYGLTEASPVLTANCPKAHKFLSIGKAFPSVELKTDASKELLARGPNIMKGYHNDNAKTEENIIDGWLKTGDLAEIDAQGFVKIIGRKKELFKTANGKYVRPIPIEQKIMQEIAFLIGAIVIAENRKFTSALLFIDFELLEKAKKKFKLENISDAEFFKSSELNNYISYKISKINKNLDHAEQVQKFALITQEISIENGEITPSMKLKRSAIETKFKDVIDGFYKS